MSLKRKPPEGNVRRVTSIGQNLRGVITNKMGRIVQFESFAERTLLLVLERDRSVIDYGSQPETFEFVDRYGKARRYTPDFIVWKENGEIEIHEVTRTERRGGTGACEREYAAQKICQARGWRYIVHTEQSLPQQTEVTNLLALVAYRLKTYARPDITTIIQEYLRQTPKRLLSESSRDIALCLHLQDEVVLPALCYLLWHGELCTDWHKLLIVRGTFTPDAMVWLPSK
jgi:hypothetical protein